MFARADVLVFSERKEFHVEPDTLSTATLQIKFVRHCDLFSRPFAVYTDT